MMSHRLCLSDILWIGWCRCTVYVNKSVLDVRIKGYLKHGKEWIRKQNLDGRLSKPKEMIKIEDSRRKICEYVDHNNRKYKIGKWNHISFTSLISIKTYKTHYRIKKTIVNYWSLPVADSNAEHSAQIIFLKLVFGPLIIIRFCIQLMIEIWILSPDQFLPQWVTCMKCFLPSGWTTHALFCLVNYTIVAN